MIYVVLEDGSVWSWSWNEKELQPKLEALNFREDDGSF